VAALGRGAALRRGALAGREGHARRDGAVLLLDDPHAVAAAKKAERLPWCELARRLEGIEGTVTLRIRAVFGTRGDTVSGHARRDGAVLLLDDPHAVAAAKKAEDRAGMEHAAVGGRLEPTESLNSSTAGRLPWCELARRLEGIEGTVTLRIRAVFGRTRPVAVTNTVSSTLLSVR
jgi:hypothetical protein